MDPSAAFSETLPSRNSKDVTSEEVYTEESIVGIAKSLPVSFSQDSSSFAKMQRLSNLSCPPLAARIDGSVQEFQDGLQSGKEESLSDSQTDQIQPHQENTGLVVTLGTQKEQSIALDYNPDSETKGDVGRQELTDRSVPLQPQIHCTVSSSPAPPSSVGFTVQDPTNYGVVVQSDRETIVLQGIHKTPSDTAEPRGSFKDSNASASLLSAENAEDKQTNLSKTQPKTVREIPNDDSNAQAENSSESIEAFKHTKAVAVTSVKETQPHPPEILETPKAKESQHGLYSSLGDQSSVPTSNPPVTEQGDGRVREAQTDAAAPSVLPEFSSKPPAGAPLFDTNLVVSLHTGEVIKTDISHTSDPVPAHETSLIAEIVHSTNAQEIVVVREGAHISGDWSNMHLNQSYLVQREDGTVCEAAIVNELSPGGAKLYEDSVHAGMELDSQPVEVYEFCGLVEEVAEETICGSSGTQIPHSPGYEVNLFNALLENTDEYTIKEDIEPSIHSANESETIIISQQPLPSSSEHDSHSLSIQKARVAAVGPHLILDNQTVEVSHSGEVCLLQVAAVASESFTVQQADTSTQFGTHCIQANATESDVKEAHGLDSPKPKAETATCSLGPSSPVVEISGENTVSVHISCLENQPSLSAHEGTKETPALTPSQSIHAVLVPSETKPDGLSATHYSSVNPKLFLQESEETPLLKQPKADATLTNSHGSWSGAEGCLSADVTKDSLSPSVVPSSREDQTQGSEEEKSAAPVEAQQSSVSASTPLQTKSDSATASTNKPEALTSTKTSTDEADAASENVETPTDTTTLVLPDSIHMLRAPEESECEVAMAASPSNPLTGVPDFEDDDSEDMEQDKPAGETEVQESLSGQVSSQEEDSDEEADESEMTSSSSSHKVRQWISERVSANSSPVSSSTSSSFLGPSSSTDWTTPRRDKSSPLRGPHGKFVSPSSAGCTSSSSPTDQPSSQRSRGERHTDMAELAKHEADIEHRTQALKREGFWSTKRLSRLTEPQRPKVHWDYLCEEMQWLSADFAQERRWKRGVARKVVRMVVRHHEELRQKEEKAKRDEHAKIRKIASNIAKEIRSFWSNVEKVVQFKQQSRLEEKRKKALDLQLDFIVGQTEKYSDLLSKSLAPSRPPEIVVSPQKTHPPAIDEDDRDFEPPCEEEDDEETIEVEEQQEGNDAESHQREIELLKEEGMLPLDQLLSTLKLPPPQASEEECSNASSSSEEEEEQEREEEEDGEFTANDEDAEDEEDTIAAQEKIEGNVDHAEELDDLNREGEMSIEELLEKYKGAYVSDFEEPSGSGSKESSNLEVSGDEEVETEEDESDVESNTSSSDSPGDSAEDEESEKEEMSNEEADDDEGMELLLKEGDSSLSSSSSRPKKEISHIAATAESLQPKGYTLATTKVKTPIPFLLHGTLREYQHIGLDWLVTMYEKKLNGILADEMGLGKTIQTIALLAHLACEKVNWGPHLIIVPTSVMLNWEMELKRWCPGFKILTYFGSQKERKLKRQGWTKPNAFHVCITSYKLVLQDHQAFRRKSWRYLILDEAQNIKNFKSQRWQSLLNFNSHRRLLLTGTPLQNSLMELWSLMHFLMPHVFQSHREFKEWFSNPLTGMIEGSQEYNEGLVKRLHKVLRPFLLRRIKADVEKQMPKKYEHVVRCRLSKRQRFLYDDFMAQASTRETLASGHFMSVINILMQLRKVCNHPNLFDPRPIQSPFITQPIVFYTASIVQDALDIPPLKRCDLSIFNLIGLEGRVTRYQADNFLPRHKVSRQLIQEIIEAPAPSPRPKPVRIKVNRMFQPPPKGDNRPVLLMNKPVCSVPPTTQTPKPAVSDVSPAPAPAPAVQQVVCSVAPTPPPRPSVHPAPQTAVRSTTPKPMLTIRAPAAPCAAGVPTHPSPNPSSVLPQRVLLSPDMQARLPSGEVVSIAQLASLAGRPISSCQGSKPVTFQLQGNKLTLSGAQIHQVPVASPRPVQGNVMHLVSSGTQHHIISQPAQLTVQTTSNTQSASTPSTTPPPNRLQNAASQAPSTMVSSQGVVKIVVRQPAGKEGVPVPTLAMAPSPRVAPLAPSHPHPQITAAPARNTAPLQIAPRTPGPATAHYTIAPPRYPSSTPSHPQPPRPILKVVQPPSASAEQPVLAPPTPSTTVLKSSTETKDNSKIGEAPGTTKTKPGVRPKVNPPPRRVPRPPPRSPFYVSWLDNTLKDQIKSRLDLISRVNDRHCGVKPVYGVEVLDFLTFLPGPHPSPAALDSEGEWSRSGHSSCLFAQWQNKDNFWFQSLALKEAIHSIEERLELLSHKIDRFTFVIPPVEASQISMHCCHPPPSLHHKREVFSSALSAHVAPLTRSLHRIQCNMRTQFPDLRLIQYDCGKLQTLHVLLRRLKTEGHRVLIFTQMTRMLDVLEQFLNYHGHIYLRLDGSTRVEQRQALMERFNADRRIFCFILSTRSGGVGVNLTGADTVVFYDSDWNPTMDAQAQDRCHRIGQTRDVHIYRLISERTVEENILKKANQKRMLGDMAIEGGNFTTAFFKQQTIRELFDVNDGEKRDAAVELSVPQSEEEEGVTKQSTTILEQALCRAEDEEDIVAASQAKAEQVAELAEFNENIPLDDGGEQEEVEELSKAEQEIAALVEQLTPIERYAMNFLEASLEDVSKEELKQAEEQVEAARKDLDQAKGGGLMLHHSSDEDNDFLSTPVSVEPPHPTPARRGRKPKDKTLTSTRTSGRLRGASPEMEPEPKNSREVPEKLRRGRGSSRDGAPAAHSQADSHKSSSSTRQHDSSKSSNAASPSRDQHKSRAQPNRYHPSSVPSSTTSPPSGGKQITAETDSRSSKAGREEEKERRMSESSLDSSYTADHLTKDDDGKEHCAVSPPYSRSPRKRQSADGEVLQGLLDDSPSAKVLRKLPGRLVTVVEEKEPRKRRRRGSDTGAGCSSEDVVVEEHAAGLFDEPNKDDTPHSPDGKPKGDDKSPQSQSSLMHRQPVRGYPPYSPPHLSPDMPVLRNLPVRSRMAAQLGEQQHLGRGRGAGQSKKTEISPGKDTAVTSTESTPNSLVTPLKRKRGRPPKTPHPLPEMDSGRTPPLQAASMNEEGDPPVSPKRKRGRPRKDSSATAEAAIEPQTLVSKSDAGAEPRVPSETPPAVSTSTCHTPQSTKAPETKTDSDSASASVSVEAAAPPASPVFSAPSAPTPVPTSTLICSSTPSLQTASVSSSVTCSTTPITAAAPSPSTIISAPPSVTTTTEVSTAAAESDSTSTITDAPPASPPTENRTPPQVNTTITAPETESVPVTEIPLMLTATTPADHELKQDDSASASPVTSTPTTTQELSETLPNSQQPSFIDMKTSQTDSTPELSQSETLNCCPPTPVEESKAAPVTAAAPPDEDTATNVTATAAPIQSASPTPTEVTAEPEKSFAASFSGPLTSSVSAAGGEVTPPPVAPEESRTPVTPTSSPTPDAEIASSATTSTDVTLTPITVASSLEELPAVTSTAPVSPVSAVAVEATTAAKKKEAPPSSNSQNAAPNSLPEPNSTSPEDSKEVTADAEAPAAAASEDETVKEASEPTQEACDPDTATDKEVDSMPESQRVETSPETKHSESEKDKGGKTEQTTTHQKEEPKQQSVEDGNHQKDLNQKRSLSRQSSQESACSSSPSSGCSTSTLTRHAHHKRTYENRHPAKKRRIDVTTEGEAGDKKEEKNEEGSEKEAPSTSPPRRPSRSSSSSSDSDSSESRKRLTRSAKLRLQDEEKEKSQKSSKTVKPAQNPDRTTNTSTGGESGSDSSSVRITRKSAASQPVQESKAQTNLKPLLPPEPEVLGKRCSALNAAAKLLAMKGRVDTPGHTTRKDPGAKAAATSTPALSEKKPVPASSPSNSVSHNKSAGSKPSTPNQTSHPPSRSTRRCPGDLVPPLEMEYKRPKTEEKDGVGKKASRGKEGEGERPSSSRGNSACSSMSSDGEGCGRSSRSRSSSNSSQRTRSVSSQNTERRSSRSRAASSGSDRDRSSERAKSRDRKERHGQKRESRSQKLPQELTSSSGTEGTPDRVLRSVAALAAVQARSPAASTRSSSGQQRSNKT